jgi:RHS repeat-associated protein
VDLTFKVADTSAPQQGDQAVLSLTIESQALTPGTIYSFASSYDHVGNLTSYSDTVMGSWGLTYDTLNRLRTAQAIAGDFSQQMPYACWSYDSFGNRVAQEQSPVAFQSGSGGPNACTPQTSATVSTVLASVNSDNQITSTNARGVTDIPTYDGAGNMQTDGANQYLYDPEGRICAVQGTTMDGITAMTGYLYDAGGNRIAKGIISSMSCDPSVNGFQVTGTYVLDKGGEELTTLDGGGDWMRTNVYAAGKLLATYDMVGNPVPANGLGSQMAGLHFHLTDPLGTRRVQVSGNIYPTNASGTLFNTVGQPETDIQSLPYGDGLYSYPDPQASATADDATPLHFTGKERDTESGNDYFGARYYASSMGRFLSPDPKLISRKRMLDPQGWNMYAYARNNPLILIDPDGAEWQWAGARNSGNAAALVHAMAIAYASNGKFRGNFDRIANSKSTIVHLSDRAVQDTTYHGSPVVGVNFGGTGLTKSSYTVSNGAVTAVTNPVNAVEQVDVTKALNSGGATDLGTVVKHETEHAVQIDSDPIGYQNAAIGANPQGSSLETEAQAAGSDTTSGSSMTFGDAQNAVMNGLGLTNADLYPDIQTETPTINATIQEESNANRPPQTNP